jgi:hypothetical protein
LCGAFAGVGVEIAAEPFYVITRRDRCAEPNEDMRISAETSEEKGKLHEAIEHA